MAQITHFTLTFSLWSRCQKNKGKCASCRSLSVVKHKKYLDKHFMISLRGCPFACLFPIEPLLKCSSERPCQGRNFEKQQLTGCLFHRTWAKCTYKGVLCHSVNGLIPLPETICPRGHLCKLFLFKVHEKLVKSKFLGFLWGTILPLSQQTVSVDVSEQVWHTLNSVPVAYQKLCTEKERLTTASPVTSLCGQRIPDR